MKGKILIFSALLLIFLTFGLSCRHRSEESEVVEADRMHNVLTEEEIADGWELLFDGETTSSWRYFHENDPNIDEGWYVHREMLVARGIGEDTRNDIITTRQFENFIFKTEWMIDILGSSGIFYMIAENDYPALHYSGIKYQLLDDLFWPEQLEPSHYTGAVYGMYAPGDDAIRPSTYWNTTKIFVNNGQVEHWLNDVKIVEYQLWTEEWEKLVRTGMWADYPGYGRHSRGHIGLQDNGSQISFRNMKIKVLE